MIYLDTSYILKCYVNEQGTSEVLALVQAERGRASSHHGRAEFWAAVHRHLREGQLSRKQAKGVWSQFLEDERAGLWHWLPVSEVVIRRACSVFEGLPEGVFLRSSDGLHLASAAENGFREIYSNDRHLLQAAKFFGLKAQNVILPHR